jgi:FKBP-type peptidyl-prolyl cis-trans isomerase FkpA
MSGRAAVVVLGLAAAGCGGPQPETDGGAAATDTVAAEVRFAPELGIDPDSLSPAEGGVGVQDVTVGRGAAAEPGGTVTIEYRAWLPDGTLYEQRPNDEGFGAPELTLGEAQPPGLNAGIEGMRAGGVRRIVIPPEQGYGLVGRPEGVPAGATLVFEVRLRSVR